MTTNLKSSYYIKTISNFSCVVKNLCATKSGIVQRTTDFDFDLEGVSETSAEEAVCPNKGVRFLDTLHTCQNGCGNKDLILAIF